MDPKYVPQPPTDKELEAFVESDGRLTDDGEQLLVDAMRVLEEAAWRNAEAHGFHESKRSFGEEIALIHSEASEALEEDREGRPSLWYRTKGVDEIYRLPVCSEDGKLRKPEGAAAEFADIGIRVGDNSRTRFKGKLGEALIRKMRYNYSRPFMHGKRY